MISSLVGRRLEVGLAVRPDYADASNILSRCCTTRPPPLYGAGAQVKETRTHRQPDPRQPKKPSSRLRLLAAAYRLVVQSFVVGGGVASMDYMRPVEAAPEEEGIKVEGALPEGWRERYAAAVAKREAHLKTMEDIWLSEGEDEDDYLAAEASNFRVTWDRLYSAYYGRFEDSTNIPNKRFTYQKPHERATTLPTLQVFSLKIAKLRAPLQWPLQVFGMVAIRDCVDHKRNIIFGRPRDNCQIVTKEDPYLKLTGPTRAVVALDPATFEVDLKVKGTTESEDQRLSLLAMPYNHFPRLESHLLIRDYASKLTKLRFQLGSVIQSVEATIEVRIISGSWPHGLRAQVTAGTASIPDAEVILLDSGDHEMPGDGIGYFRLSRCVVSVEDGGKLRVCVKAILDDEIVAKKVMHFKSKTSSVSSDSCMVDFYKKISKAKTAGKGNRPTGVDCIGYCTLGFNISWSLISYKG